MMRWIRGMVYKLGFRPKLGSVFYSPSMVFTYLASESFDKMIEGWAVLPSDWTIQPLPGINTEPIIWPEDLSDLTFAEERIKKILALPDEGLTGIVTSVSVKKEETTLSYEDMVKAMDAILNDGYKKDRQGSPPVYQNDGKNAPLFYCPLCGGPLELGEYYFMCGHHEYFEIAIVKGQIQVKSVKKSE